MEHFLPHSHYLALFLLVLVEQGGLPIPALPMLIGAGALVASGDLNLGLCLVLVIAASLIADVIWFYLGRWKGLAILHLICRLSWKPNVCISKTKNMFGSRGLATLLFAKFLPGLSTLAPPLAGATGASLGKFLLWDLGGAAIWALLSLLTGMGLKSALPGWEESLHLIKSHLPELVLALVFLYALGRFLWRWRYVAGLNRELKRSLSPVELKSMIDRGEKPVLIDVRHEINCGLQPLTLPGALHIPYGKTKEEATIPLERPLIVFCDCPRDEAAFQAVKALRAEGAESVRMLRGGIQAWEAEGFPLVGRGERSGEHTSAAL